jgi:hypothetical protein
MSSSSPASSTYSNGSAIASSSAAVSQPTRPTIEGTKYNNISSSTLTQISCASFSLSLLPLFPFHSAFLSFPSFFLQTTYAPLHLTDLGSAPWRSDYAPSYYEAYSNASDASVTFKFTGVACAYFAHRNRFRGIALLTVDYEASRSYTIDLVRFFASFPCFERR